MTTPSHNARKAILADRIFDGRRWHDGGAVLIDGRRISAVVTTAEIPPAYSQRPVPAGTFLAPGFVDLQVNGGGGVLLNENPSADAMLAIAGAHRVFGTTSCLPTFITDTREKTQEAIAAAKSVAGRDGILGLHLEGPFINPARAGVHRREYIVAPEMKDLELLMDLARAGRSLVTLAPERVPEEFIYALASGRIRIAAGHSEASASVMQCAIGEGLSGVTHLFNAMPPFSGRAPGIVGMAFGEPRLTAGIIADGVHVDPISIRAAFAAKGAGTIALVTDAMPSIGTAASDFELMGTKVTLRGGALRCEDGTLAGAHLDMATAVRNAVRLAGIPLEDALHSASSTPAGFLGLEGERGELVAGAFADIVALNSDLEVLAVWAEGVEFNGPLRNNGRR